MLWALVLVVSGFGLLVAGAVLVSPAVGLLVAGGLLLAAGLFFDFEDE